MVRIRNKMTGPIERSYGVQHTPPVSNDNVRIQEMADLGHAERFLVWALRRWAMGLLGNNARHWTFVWYEFETQLGDIDGKAGLANFAKMSRALQLYALRPRVHQHPCCPAVARDETWFVDLVAAFQAGRLDDARHLVRDAVEPAGFDVMLEAASRLAYLMHRHALYLTYSGSEDRTIALDSGSEARERTMH